MNQNEIKKLKEIVIYKGLHYYRDDKELMTKLEQMGYVELNTEREYVRPTQKGIDYLIESGYLE